MSSRIDLYRHTGLVPMKAARRACLYAWAAGATVGFVSSLFVWGVTR